MQLCKNADTSDIRGPCSIGGVEGVVAGYNKCSMIVTGAPNSYIVPFISISNHSSVQEDDNYTVSGSTGMQYKLFWFSGAKIISVPFVDSQTTEKWGYLSLTKICMYHNCRQSGSQSFPENLFKMLADKQKFV